MMLTRTILAATAIASAAYAQDGVLVLQDAAAAIKELNGVTFNAHLANSPGSFTAEIQTDINVKMVRSGENGPWVIRYSGQATGLGTAGDQDGELRIEVHDDGQATTWIDFADEKVQIRRSRVARSSALQMAEYGTQILEAFTAPAPFADAIGGGAEVTLEGQATIGGVPCDLVRISEPEMNITETWAIAHDDRLPRKLVTGIPQMGETTITITDLTVNPGLSPEDLAIDPPPNFEVVDRGPGATPAPTAPAEPVRAIGTDLGNEAPDFELLNAEGEIVHLQSLRPNIVVLSFWGSWCIPCREANEHLQALAEAFEGQDVKVVSLACKEADAANAIAAHEEHGYTFGLLVDADKTARLYQIRRYPTIFVLGREGEVLHTARGFSADENPFPKIQEAVEKALAAPNDEQDEKDQQAGQEGAEEGQFAVPPGRPATPASGGG